tara:strand:- start:66 stop:185 length:120 start_codon:yes stop_codon:yes gene_type:complete
MIKVKYQLKEHLGVKLFKFFKTKDHAESFKSQNPNYIFD